MKEYEKCRAIRNYMVTRIAEIINYDWGAEFSYEQAKEVPDKIVDSYGTVDITQLTDEQMEELGFGKWSDKTPIRLIPLWLYPFLPEEIEIQSIGGESKLKKEDMDNDHRFGCLAYGIKPKDKTQ